ncbi:MAG TPA: hypothetical protein VGM06_21235 [Polyangiaceae bacterium]|jgi:hypothetical protein
MKTLLIRHVVLPSVLFVPFGLSVVAACSSSTSTPTPDGGAFGVAPAPTCASPGGPASVEAGGADMHCDGVPPQPISLASCMVLPDAAGDDGGDTSAPDAGPPLPCGEDGPSYGSTMYGTSGDDDDCKYHVSYSVGGICENEGVFFVVTATQLANNMPLTGADPLIEVCLNDTHPSPGVDAPPPAGHQVAREDSANPGTYTIGPIQFDVAGKWTIRFHFYETCYDTLDDSPHGHAAFFMDVP